MENTLVSIDPGASGGIAWQHPGEVALCKPMPETEGDVVALIRELTSKSSAFGVPRVFIEDLVKHMGSGIPASTMAVYARNWGFMAGCFQYAGCPVRLVNPRNWAKSLGLGKSDGNKADWKRKLKSEAQRLYPHLEVTLKTADALLILEWARRNP